MKKLFTLTLLFAFVLYADDHVESTGYEPNVAEYYVSSFKDGKDMDDMMRWAAKWTKWAEESEALKDYRSAMLVPYYHSGELLMILFGLALVQILKHILAAMIIGSTMVRNFKLS